MSERVEGRQVSPQVSIPIIYFGPQTKTIGRAYYNFNKEIKKTLLISIAYPSFNGMKLQREVFHSDSMAGGVCVLFRGPL